MYGKYFNIDEGAFSIAPNPKYLYLSPQHQEALAHLLYGVTRPGGFVLITGEIGTGKTTICRSLFQEAPEETDIALIINPKLNVNDLLASICDELKISYPKTHPTSKTYISKLNEHLIKTHAEGRNTILIIDEAQNLNTDTLEAIRVLTNLETDEQKLLQIILIGQPELRDRLNAPEMEQLNQRITARFHLRALSPKQVKEYIKHRLKTGEGNEDLFSNSNINYVYKLTGGIPRLINVLCDRTLLGAYVLRKKTITNEIIQKAAREALGKRIKPRVVGINWAMVMALSIAGLLIAATVLIFLYEKNPELFVSAKETDTTKTVASNVAQVIPALEEVKESGEDEVEISSVNDENLVVNDEEIKQVQSLVDIVEEEIVEEDTQQVENDKAEVEVLSSLAPRQWAFHVLFRSWNIEYSDANSNPCEFAQQHELLCFSGRGDVRMLQRLNRPVILTKGQSSQLTYLVIQSAQQNEVVVLEPGGSHRVSWQQIQDYWQGEFELLWKPLARLEYIRPSMRGDFVKDIDRNLSIVLNRPPEGGTLSDYTDSMVEEVKIFQRMQRIVPDGVIGPLTQIYMNNLVRSDVPKLR